jgi:hypothetical protein
MDQVVEYLPNKYKALRSNPSSTKKRKEKEDFKEKNYFYWNPFLAFSTVIFLELLWYKMSSQDHL